MPQVCKYACVGHLRNPTTDKVCLAYELEKQAGNIYVNSLIVCEGGEQTWVIFNGVDKIISRPSDSLPRWTSKRMERISDSAISCTMRPPDVETCDLK